MRHQGTPRRYGIGSASRDCPGLGLEDFYLNSWAGWTCTVGDSTVRASPGGAPAAALDLPQGLCHNVGYQLGGKQGTLQCIRVGTDLQEQSSWVYMLIVPGIVFDPYTPAEPRIQAIEIVLEELSGFQIPTPVGMPEVGTTACSYDNQHPGRSPAPHGLHGQPLIPVNVEYQLQAGVAVNQHPGCLL